MNKEGDLNLKKAIEKSGFQDRIFIWGASDKSRPILEKIKQWGFCICGFIDRNYINIKEYEGYHVYGIEELKNKCFVYVALQANYVDVIKTLEQLGYQEFINYWYPGKLVELDGTQNYQDMYGNQLTTYNKKKITIRLRNGGKIKVESNNLDDSTKITSEGNATVSIGSNVYTGEKVIISNTNGTIEIEEGCKLGSHITLRTSCGGAIFIHKKTTIQRLGAIVASFHAKVVLKADCMLSYLVLIRAGNSHNMIDLDTGCHLDDNNSRDVILGEHVWVGMRATIMNGVEVGSGSTIGANTFLCKKKYGSNCCVAGNPPRVLRKRTAWMRDGVSMKKDVEDYKEYIYDN